MFARLAALFVIVPAVELAILYRLAGVVGFWPEVGLIVATGFVGAALARHQGRATLRRLKTDAAAGRPPADAAVDSVLILVAGALLLTPGLLADAVGFSLLIPGLRRSIKRGVARALKNRVDVRVASVVPPATRPDVFVVEPTRLRDEPRPSGSRHSDAADR